MTNKRVAELMRRCHGCDCPGSRDQTRPLVHRSNFPFHISNTRTHILSTMIVSQFQHTVVIC